MSSAYSGTGTGTFDLVSLNETVKKPNLSGFGKSDFGNNRKAGSFRKYGPNKRTVRVSCLLMGNMKRPPDDERDSWIIIPKMQQQEASTETLWRPEHIEININGSSHPYITGNSFSTYRQWGQLSQAINVYRNILRMMIVMTDSGDCTASTTTTVP
ncbi:hypothetical protein C5167_037073, partial [Papaver somniferum]